MDSITLYDIPAVIIALLGVSLSLFGGWLGIDAIARINTNTKYSGGEVMALMIAICAVFVGLAAMLFGVWFIRENTFKLSTAIFSGILTVGFLRLIVILEVIENPGYGTAIQLLIISVSVLVWCLLRGIELRWEMNFSQKMDR